jgi:hypothetical protein
MSTPNPPNSRVEGLELYAPRRARGQAATSGQEQPSTSDHPTSDQERFAADERPEQASASDAEAQAASPSADLDDQQRAGDDAAPWGDDEAPDEVQARIDDAVNAVFDMEREFREERRERELREAPAAPLPRAANLTPSHEAMPPRDQVIWASPASDLQSRGPRLDRSAWLTSRLDPEIVPEPPADVQRRILPLLIRFSLVIGVAAIVAYGLTMMSSLQSDETARKPGGGGAATAARVSDEPVVQQSVTHEALNEPQVAARLVVENQHAYVNEPIPLAASVAPSTGEESLVVAGLAAGSRLSAGAPVSESSWRLRSHDLDGLYLYAPKDFVGVMNTAVDLLSPSQRLLDSRAVRLEWIAKKQAPVARSAPPDAGNTAVASLQPSNQADTANANLPAVQPLDPEQVALLMKRGRDAMGNGDIASARLAFRRLADAGNAEGALRLAATYDPRYLAGQNVIGVSGDETQARLWYQRAMALGSVEAKNILAQMATK